MRFAQEAHVIPPMASSTCPPSAGAGGVLLVVVLIVSPLVGPEGWSVLGSAAVPAPRQWSWSSSPCSPSCSAGCMSACSVSCMSDGSAAGSLLVLLVESAVRVPSA